MAAENVHGDQVDRPGDDKQFDIVVNGRPKAVPSDELTFDEVLSLAFDPVPTGPNMMFAVTYWNGGGRPPEGTLVHGGRVKIQDGTVFNVTATDKS
jgi:hypothetical protein